MMVGERWRRPDSSIINMGCCRGGADAVILLGRLLGQNGGHKGGQCRDGGVVKSDSGGEVH